MRSQSTNPNRFNLRNHLLPLALAVTCAAGGCWREVEYAAPPVAKTPDENAPASTGQVASEPEPASSPVESSTAEPSKAAANQFGDDLAATFSAEESAKAVETDAKGEPMPMAESEPQAAALVGDRYASTSPSPSEAPSNVTIESTPAASDENNLTSLFGEPAESNEPLDSTDDGAMPAEQREATAETDNAPIVNHDEDEVQTPLASETWTTRRSAWLLGSKLSLASLSNEHGAPAEFVQKLFGQSAALAQKLGVSIKELPARRASSSASSGTDPAIDYLLTEGQEIGRELIAKFGPDHAALFEVAVKSNVLLVIYQPGAPIVEKIALSIEQASTTADLPTTLWQPLLDALAAKVSVADVRKAVYKMHDATTKYLDETAPHKT